ncbi:hypothetical protein [Pseudonocardia sp. WMMC193]|uniref:hypothetical protein n=1 Tax=Pseudonocardia sp. WMMC193 TaxID=2911965 RepID=UPI001F36DB5E|nr:hypothetical protein [Pseudonocardia sp. WMMC193]MCF7548912.1 hypothetical protein [Pseudonocardia sp. WMMC193]
MPIRHHAVNGKSQAHRPHAAQAMRRPPKTDPPPAPPIQPVEDQAVTDWADIRVERLKSGRWRISLLDAPTWVQAAADPPALARVMWAAFRETRELAAAAKRNRVSSLALLGSVRITDPVSRGGRRGDVYHCLSWRMTEDGMWLSPRGLKYKPTAQVVARVQKRRVELGYEPEPQPGEPIPDGPPVNRHRPLRDTA